MLTYRQNHAPAITHMGSPVWTPEEDARAIELDEAGKSFTEIGKELGKTRNAVSSRLRRIAHWKSNAPRNGVGSQPRLKSVMRVQSAEEMPFATADEADCYRAGFMDAALLHFGTDKLREAQRIRKLMIAASKIAGPLS
jgi:hypothetical protein